MNTVYIPNLPESHIEFAKAIMSAADAAGVDRAQVTYRPSFETQRQMGITGEIQIIYSSTDGRGRPCKRLAIQLNMVAKTDIVKEPESFS